LVIKNPESRLIDWIRIWIGIQPKMLDPKLYQMNTDLKHRLLVVRRSSKVR